MKNTRPVVRLATSISALLVSFSAAQAVDYTWIGTTGDWSNPSNWNNGLPGGGGGNFVIVNNGGVVNITSDTNPIQDPFIGRGVGSSGTINQTAGNHVNSGWTFIGTEGGTGQWNLSGNTSFTTGRLYLGGRRESNGGTGSMSVATTGTVTAGGDLSIGTRGGSGTLSVSSGTVNANTWLIVGETVNGTGGSTGVVNQTGGVVSNGVTDANGRFWLGSNEGNSAGAASNGTYNLIGGTLNARNVSIGKNYTGTINQSGGVANITAGADDSRLGVAAGSVGNYYLTGGTLNVAGNFQVGASGTGLMEVSGGTLNNAGWFVAGRFAGSTGTVNVTSGSFIHNGDANSVIIGEEGTGVLNISGTGLVNVNSNLGLRLGHTATANGTINLNAGGTLQAHFIQKTNGSSIAKLNLDGGTLKAGANSVNFLTGLADTDIEVKAGGANIDTNGFNISINQSLNGVGGLNKSGAGTLTLNSFSSGYTGATTITGGTLSVSTLVDGSTPGPLGASSNAASNLVFNGGTLQYTGFGGSSDRNFTINPGTTATIDVTSPGSVMVLTGGSAATNGGLTKIGNGTLSLAGVNQHTGLTSVNGGVLAASGTYAGGFAVNAGGHLTALAGSEGTLTVPTLSLGAGSALDFEFGFGNDQIIISNPGGLTLGTTGLYLYDTGSTNPFVANGTYTLIDYTGTFTGSLNTAFSIANSQIGKVYGLTNNTAATRIELTIADAVSTTWVTDGGGLWTAAGNWSAGVPNSIGAIATFGNALSGGNSPALVNVNGPKTVGVIIFDNPNVYDLTGGAGDTITLNNGFGTPLVSQVNGSHRISAPIVINAPTTNFAATSGTTLTVSGNISGTGALALTDFGSVTLTGTNSYGATNIAAGSLSIGDGGTTGTLGAGPVTMADGTSLSFFRSNNLTVTNALSGTGSVSHLGSGTLTYTGSATYTGATVLLGAFVNEGSLVGTNGLVIESAATLRGTSNTVVNGATSVASDGLSTGSITIQDVATAAFNGAVNIANTTGNQGSLNVNTSGTVQVQGALSVGTALAATGTLNIDSGTITQGLNGSVNIGANGGTGTLDMSGGSLASGNGGLKFADGGSGSQGIGLVSGGTLSTTGELWVGNNTGNSATLSVSGGVVSTSSWLAVGRLGAQGTVNLTGGTLEKTVNNGTHIIIGSIAGVGIVNQSGNSAFNSISDIRIGENDNGLRSDGSLWDMSGGTSNVGGTINVAWRSSTAGWNLSNGTVTAGRLAVGSENGAAGDAIGTVTITGGSLTITGAAGESRIGGDISGATTAQGTLNLDGGSINSASNLQIGAYGVGTLNMTAGTLETSGWPVVGRFAGSTGTANFSGGVFNHTNDATALIIGEDGTGTVNITGSGVVNARSIRMGHTATGVGTLNLQGGTLTTRFIQKTNAGSQAQVILDGGLLRAADNAPDFFIGFTDGSITVADGGANIDTNGFSVGISQSLTGIGNLTKTGDGTLTLSGVQDYPLLTTNDGRTDLLNTLGVGGSSIQANADTNLAVSQVLASLVIGEGATVTLGDLPPPAPEFVEGAPLFDGEAIANSPSGPQAVPEPGSVMLLMAGIGSLLGLRRRR